MDVNISLLLRKGKAGTENEHNRFSAGAGLAPMDALGIFHLFDKLIRSCL